MSQTYTARSLDRNGRRVFTTGEHSTREAAVAEAFAARPNCTVSSSQALGVNVQFHQPAPVAEPVREEAVATARECGAVEIEGEFHDEVADQVASFRADPSGWTDKDGMRYRCNRCRKPMLSLLPAYSTSGACECGGLIEADPRNFAATDPVAVEARNLWDLNFAGKPGFPESDFPEFLAMHRRTVERFKAMARGSAVGHLIGHLAALKFDAFAPLADLPGNENSGTRFNEYETLVAEGLAELRVVPLFTNGVASGCRHLFRLTGLGVSIPHEARP